MTHVASLYHVPEHCDNMHDAVQERSVQFDPRNSPVLKWRAVQLAQQTVLSRRKKISDMASKAGAQLFL